MEHKQIARLLEIMATLRGPKGCPWDAQQTPQSLKPYLLEETYEALEALDEGSPDNIREELGDLLLQVVFLARIFEERGEFTFEEIAGGIADKLVRRHPHVFGDLDESDADALHKNWDRIKAAEKNARPQGAALISPPPRTLPALQRAQKMLTKMSRYGLSLPAGNGADTSEEQLPRLRNDLKRANAADAERDLGELLLRIADLARRNRIDAEAALRKCTDRLVNKAGGLEEALKERGLNLANAPEETRKDLWDDTLAED